MIKISEPPAQVEFKQDLKQWFIFSGIFVALFILLIFRWSPIQIVLAALTSPCPEVTSALESTTPCQKPDWIRIIGSSW